LRGFVHAHVGWLFRHDQRGSRARYATDLLADPVIRFVDRTFVLWALGGLALAFGLGVVIGGSLTAGLTGLLQGKRARRQSDPARPLRTRSGRGRRARPGP
jgi:stearoyl-CoA desaturase (delta-9 desaturase)